MLTFREARAFTDIEIVLLVIRLTVHYVVTRRASVGRSATNTLEPSIAIYILFLITTRVSFRPILLHRHLPRPERKREIIFECLKWNHW